MKLHHVDWQEEEASRMSDKLKAVNDCDSFDLSMMLILVEAAQCELAHVKKTYTDAIALLKVQQKNSKCYKKKKM